MIRGLIGGTGCLSLFQGERQEIKVTTPYGVVAHYEVAKECYLLLRHGKGHTIPPHMINYRANIWALNEVGVEALLGIYAVGSISDHLKVGEASIVEQFIDFSGGGRPSTFFDDEAKHINLEHPYSQLYNSALLAKAQEEGIPLKEGGVYVCTNGPRLETPAEIEMLRRLGGDYVGMTGATETILANELSIPFSAIAYSINWAAGIKKELTFLPQEEREPLLKELAHLFVVTDSLPKGVVES